MGQHGRLTPARALDFRDDPREVPCRGPPGTARHLKALAGWLGGWRFLGAWSLGDE
jgi:hypothetical protein